MSNHELVHLAEVLIPGWLSGPWSLQRLNDNDAGEKHTSGTASGLGCLPRCGISGFLLPILPEDELTVQG